MALWLVQYELQPGRGPAGGKGLKGEGLDGVRQFHCAPENNGEDEEGRTLPSSIIPRGDTEIVG